ncbi:unnamed protein product [Spirodela intermedia]|uniref:Uncharacterized protein n=1 Tax=Spirodela intermedia TaxID=51605 RepID=A0A7I8JP66_SPIIN|nr:unnamed protein product [Spirodela intermedia]CAA6671949.1 unnamed protein product [Spirodela intermedia]
MGPVHFLMGPLRLIGPLRPLTRKAQRPPPDTSPSRAPQPFLPFLAPSPLAPFSNNVIPKLSGLCALNFSSADSMIRTTAVDCWTSLAPFLANVICCPQLQATLVVLLGQSSRETGSLALDAAHANHCLSDLQKILGARARTRTCGRSAPCPVGDVDGVESVVDSSQLLAACKRVDSVNECCSQICQNAILDASRKMALSGGDLPGADGNRRLQEHRHEVAGQSLDPPSAKQLLRRISNCNVNRVCPLVFPDAKSVARDCGNAISNRTACCVAMDNYVSHLQKQSFITNLQALDCASQLGRQLQEMNISANVYSLCQVTLKDFSLQVGSQESGCLLPSLPSDATFDQFSGISFTCDLNDNIAAPWPSASLLTSSSCNKSVTLPALPAATSGQSGKLSAYSHCFALLISLMGLLVIQCHRQSMEINRAFL